MEEEQVCDGIVVWYNERKGYGFVEVVHTILHDQPVDIAADRVPAREPEERPKEQPDEHQEEREVKSQADKIDDRAGDTAPIADAADDHNTPDDPANAVSEPSTHHPSHSEVFLHRTALDRFGLIGIFTGDKVRARIAKSQRGWVITDLISVERTQIRRIATHAPQQANEVHGIVKFFNAEKGYGFVDIGQLGNDVFVHLRTLRNCGIHHLTEGQHLLVQITDDGKGPQAAEVRLMPVQLNQMDIDL